MSNADKIKTIYVFVDTSIFRTYQFDWMNPALQKLIELCQKGKVFLLTNNIVLMEARAEIQEQTTKAFNYFKKTTEKTLTDYPVLKNTPLCQMPSFDKFRIKNILTEQLDKFFNDCNAIFVPLFKGNISNIVDQYFNKKPPFGEGKKKHEFPDAITIESLKEWCDENDQEILILSEDGDFRNACELYDKLYYLGNLPEFLERIARFYDEELVERALASISFIKQDILNSVLSKLQDCQVVLSDADGEAYLDYINDVLNWQPAVADVQFIERDFISAEILIDSKLELHFEVDFYEPGTGYYDKEDQEWYYRDRIKDQIYSEHNVPITILMSFSLEETNSAQIDEISLDINYIEIEVYPY